MNRTQQRRSVTPGHIPAVGDLLVGEIALNLADKDAFFSTGVEIVHLNAAANIKTDAAHRFISDAQLAILAAGYTLPVSSASVLGGVKIGANIDVDAEGVISLKTASASQAGLLSAADFAAFADKQDALGYVPVNKAGDVMGGALTLFGAPVSVKCYARTQQKTNAEKLRIAEKKRQTILGKSDEEKLRIAEKKRASRLRTVALRTRADKNAIANNIRDGLRRRLMNP